MRNSIKEIINFIFFYYNKKGERSILNKTMNRPNWKLKIFAPILRNKINSLNWKLNLFDNHLNNNWIGLTENKN